MDLQTKIKELNAKCKELEVLVIASKANLKEAKKDLKAYEKLLAKAELIAK